MIHRELILIPVEPQPRYTESSGRWCWPLPDIARFPGCCTEVVTASREWWEYAPSEAKPHPMAEGVRLRDDIWYWAVLGQHPMSASDAALMDWLSDAEYIEVKTKTKLFRVDGQRIRAVIDACIRTEENIHDSPDCR